MWLENQKDYLLQFWSLGCIADKSHMFRDRIGDHVSRFPNGIKNGELSSSESKFKFFGVDPDSLNVRKCNCTIHAAALERLITEKERLECRLLCLEISS